MNRPDVFCTLFGNLRCRCIMIFVFFLAYQMHVSLLYIHLEMLLLTL